MRSGAKAWPQNSQERSSGSSKKDWRESLSAEMAGAGTLQEAARPFARSAGERFYMTKTRFALVSALLLAGAAPLIAQAAARHAPARHTAAAHHATAPARPSAA